jgi:hypothetical protein
MRFVSKYSGKGFNFSLSRPRGGFFDSTKVWSLSVIDFKLSSRILVGFHRDWDYNCCYYLLSTGNTNPIDIILRIYAKFSPH